MVAPAKRVYSLELLAQRLDHDFFCIVNFVNHQPERSTLGLQHHDVDCISRWRQRFRSPGQFQYTAQINQRQQPAAQPVHRSALNHLDALAHLVGLQPHKFEQAHLRYGVAIAAAGHHQRWDNGQGQGNLYPNRRALARVD